MVCIAALWRRRFAFLPYSPDAHAHQQKLTRVEIRESRCLSVLQEKNGRGGSDVSQICHAHSFSSRALVEVVATICRRAREQSISHSKLAIYVCPSRW